MKNLRPWIIAKNEIINKQVEEGDFVMYFTVIKGTNTCVSKVGIISKEFNDNFWIIQGSNVDKFQVLFVVTVDGYLKQIRYQNSLIP